MKTVFETFVEDLCAAEDLVDIGPNAVASQSSTSQWSRPNDAQRAFQSVDTDFAFHTDHEKSPWWECQFDHPHAVEYIIIHNRERRAFQHLSAKFCIHGFYQGEKNKIVSGDLCFGAAPTSMPLVLPLRDGNILDGLRIELRNEGYLHLKEINILCKRENVGWNSKKYTFLATRRDGFGERLKAMLNAMRLAKVTEGQFCFSWQPMSGAMKNAHAVLPREDTFAPEFISEFHISEQNISKEKITSLPKVASKIAKNKTITTPYVIVGQGSIGNQTPHLNHLQVSGGFEEEFSKISFSTELEEARSLALSAPLPDNLTALHLRAGDIIYGRYRFMSRYVRKACPYPIAADLIKTSIELGENVILFGQDKDLIDALGRKYNTLIANDIVPSEELSTLQRAIFDICLMSRCRKIYAGRSGFSIVASWIKGIDIIDPYTLYQPNEALEVLNKAISQDDGVSDLQKAFSYAAMFEYKDHFHPPEGEQIARRALSFDPKNCFYALRLAVYLTRQGAVSEADSVLRQTFYDIGKSDWSILDILTHRHPDDTFTVSEFIDDLLQMTEQGSASAALCISLYADASGNSKLAIDARNMFDKNAVEADEFLKKYLSQ